MERPESDGTVGGGMIDLAKVNAMREIVLVMVMVAKVVMVEVVIVRIEEVLLVMNVVVVEVITEVYEGNEGGSSRSCDGLAVVVELIPQIHVNVITW